MNIVVVVTAFLLPEHRARVVAAFEEAIRRVHDGPGVEIYALHEGRDRLVMIEKYASEQARSAGTAFGWLSRRPGFDKPADLAGPPYRGS
jgi:hypothetical protein